MVQDNTKRLVTTLTLGAVLIVAVGCGGGYGYDEYYEGDVEVGNFTAFDVIYYFDLVPSGAPPAGDLLYEDVFPGEIQYVGTFFEDYYDGEAFLDTLPETSVWFPDTFIEGDTVTTFEVF